MAGRPADGVGGIDGDTWLEGLPGIVAERMAEWDLVPDGDVHHGFCAIVAEVRRGDEPLVLKVTWPHEEARLEHLALRLWAGRGAVGLVAAQPSQYALLLERLDPHRDLRSLPAIEACGVIGGLLRELDRPAPPQVPRLSATAERWATELRAATPELGRHLPRRFVEQAVSLLGDLSRPSMDDRLLHTDLHYENVLAGTRAPWLAIDPKPMAAELEFAAFPVLLNRLPEAHATGDVKWELSCRLGALCEASGMDEERAKAWTIVRTVDFAAWSLADSAARGLAPERPTLTDVVTLLKAMQPSD